MFYLDGFYTIGFNTILLINIYEFHQWFFYNEQIVYFLLF